MHLRERDRRDRAGAEDDIGGDPAVQPRQGSRERRCHRLDHGGGEGKAEQRGDGDLDQRVGDDPEQRHRAELEPEDRRGCDATSGRDGDGSRELCVHGIALEHAQQWACGQEDRNHCRERELETGVGQRVRIPGEQDDRREQQHMPRVTLARHQPRDRRRGARDRRPDHGRLRPDGKHIRPDRRQRRDVRPRARQPDRPREPEHPGREQHDVRARHREQVVEPTAAERLLEPGRQAVVVAEHDPFQDRAPFSRQPGCGGAAQPRAQPVADPREPAAAPTGVAPVVDAKDDMDALPAQPGALVEAVRRPARQPHERQHVDEGALRRRAPKRQLELDALVDVSPGKAEHAARLSLIKLSDARLAGHLDERPARAADLRPQWAAIKCVEPHTSPPPPDQREQRRRTGEARRGWEQQRARDTAKEHGRGRAAKAQRQRRRETERGSRHQDVCGQHSAHGTTSPRRSAMRDGPMPEIASSSSTERNEPCCWR